MVNGRAYGCLRLYRPDHDAKYLTPRDSGSQLYVPANGGPFGRELVLCEGEFKALSLCEAGARAVAVRGISSAMPGGKMLPDLKQLLTKFPSINVLYFLGDADTTFNYGFSLEATKLAKVLPATVELKLPRIPVGGGNGIDDCRQERGDKEFPAFWGWIKDGAVEVPQKSEASTIAAELLTLALPAIGELPDWRKRWLPKIVVLVGRLAPIDLDDVARALKEQFGINAGALKEQAAQVARKQAQLPEATKTLPEIYFTDDGRYYRRNATYSGFESIGREDVMLHLRENGWPHRLAKMVETTPCEDMLHRMQMMNRVNYAGPFCGRPPGKWKETDVTILATRGPTIIEGKQGDAEMMVKFWESLLGKGHDPFFEEQYKTLLGWLKHGRVALRNYLQHLPGQLLALIGPAGCGKSLGQSFVTFSLGGRQVDPSGYLVKGSAFNSEMWGAEHLRLGDEELIEDGRGGIHKLRERLKKVVVADEYPFHAKYVNGRSARPIWRTTLSANDDSESIGVLPPPSASFSDKVSYLRCYAPAKPYHDGSDEARREYWRRMMEALPAFLYIVDNFEVPEKMRSSRFYVGEFHHPEVIEMIERASPVYAVAEVLTSLAKRNGALLEGTATELFHRCQELLVGHTSSAPHLGHQLQRLKYQQAWKGCITSTDNRIGPNRQLQIIWKINAPPLPQEDENHPQGNENHYQEDEKGGKGKKSG